MPLFDFREPVSVWTHGAGLIAAFPVTWLLLRRCLRFGWSSGYQRGKFVGLAVFGFGMAFCYAASTAYHAARVDGEALERLRRLDLVGIFFLIAGTYTPVAWALMRPFWKQRSIALVWGLSLLCAGMILAGGPFPTWLATTIYLSLGWGMAFGYYDIQHAYRHKTLMALPIGGTLYSVGATINLLHAPSLIPGVFDAHELFHVFVLAGTAAHVYFLFAVVVPAQPPVPGDGRAEARPSRRPSTEPIAPSVVTAKNHPSTSF